MVLWPPFQGKRAAPIGGGLIFPGPPVTKTRPDGACALRPVGPKKQDDSMKNKWILGAVLAAIAAFMYVSVFTMVTLP